MDKRNKSKIKIDFEVGSNVEIVNPGKGYSMYKTWLEKNFPLGVKKFVNGVIPETGTVGVISHIASHDGDYNDDILCAVDCGEMIFIMGYMGLKKISSYNINLL